MEGRKRDLARKGGPTPLRLLSPRGLEGEDCILLKQISKWWDGETKAYDMPYVIGIYTERHWTSHWAHVAFDFYLRHWQWLWGSAIAIFGIYVAYTGVVK